MICQALLSLVLLHPNAGKLNSYYYMSNGVCVEHIVEIGQYRWSRAQTVTWQRAPSLADCQGEGAWSKFKTRHLIDHDPDDIERLQ